MKQETIDKFISNVDDCVKSGLSRAAYCKNNKMGQAYFTRTLRSILNSYKNGKLDDDNFGKVVDAASKLGGGKLVNMLQDKETYIQQVDSEDRTETSYERDSNGKIKYYVYKIYIKNRQPLTGKLSREEMNSIYRLYSYYGAGLTQREISRQFPDLSLMDFKRILRAFNITKACCQFPVHMIEEYSNEELHEISLREKENDFLRKIEQTRLKDTETLLKKYAEDNAALKDTLKNRKEILSDICNKEYESKLITPKSNIGPKTFIIFLSDLHIGAYNETEGYIKLENYNEGEIKRRLSKIFSVLKVGEYSNIVVFNLGDEVDSYNKQTTRGGHDLPTVISNKEQSKMYLRIMLWFFNNLLQYSKNISYYCVGESNHSGDWGWINDTALSYKLNSLGIYSKISDNPIDMVDIQDTTLIYMHGNDNNNQFKGFPLTVNLKTENWFNSFFVDSKYSFKSKKIVIKGDLHQYAYSKAKTFDYISMPSLYGSSQWIVANFGKTDWGLAYGILDENNNLITGIVNDL